MYEIPPSVDWYLRISSRSRIHYPAVNEDPGISETPKRSYNNSSKNNEKPIKLPAGDKSSSPGSESPSDITRKRKFDELEENAERKRSKSDDEHHTITLQTNYSRNYYVEKWLNNSMTAKADRKAIPPTATSTESKEESKEDYHKIEELVKQFPEIRPRLNGESNVYYQPKGKSIRKNPWGAESYSDLISSAISSFPNNRATLQQIYEWIVENVPHFADKAHYPSTKGWKNAIRHTLSIRKRFTRIINDTSPHSSLWTFSKRPYKTGKY